MTVERGVVALAIMLFLISALANAQAEGPYKVDLNLSKTTYLPNEAIDGNARLFFNIPVSAETTLKISLNNISSTKKLSALLTELQIAYTATATKTSAANPTSSKTLIFNEAGSQRISFKLPKGAMVDAIDSDVEGLQYNSTYPRSPSMDVGDDGFAEWEYKGGLTGYMNNISSATLDQNTDSPTIINNNLNYYCQKLNLPSAKDFRITARYSKYSSTSTNANLTATILSFQQSGGSITITGTNRCDLPEPSSTTAGWGSCDINLQNAISGDYMVCVHNKDAISQNTYYLSTSTATSTTAYSCQNSCSTFSNDFYVMVRAGNYSDSFSERQKISQGITQYSMKQAMTDYLATCQSATADCAVPVAVKSNSKGKLTLSNLIIQYTSNGVAREEKNFYDLSTQVGMISTIDNINLSQNATTNISIPITNFKEFTAPQPENNKTTLYEIKLEVNPGPDDSDKIKVDKSAQAGTQTTSVEAYLDNTKSRLEEMLSDYPEITRLTELKPGMEAAIQQIAAKQTEAAAIKASNASDTDKKLEAIRTDVKNLVSKLPKSIIEKQSITDKSIVGPNDIPLTVLNGMPGDKVYFYQKTLDITAKATLYELTFFGGPVAELTFVEKSIPGVSYGSRVYESIPNSIIAAGDIAFEPVEASSGQGYFEFGSSSRVTYVYEGNLLSSLSELKTFVVPEKLPTEIEKSITTCGDNVCTVLKIGDEEIPVEDEITCPADCKPKEPWTWVIILIILGIAGVIYLNFFSKTSHSNIFHSKLKQDLFADPKDKQNLIDYINKATEKGITKPKIREILSAKGWTDKQIDAAFSAAKK